MATFFGEVILPSSRAFFEDYDDSDNDDEEPSVKIKPRLVLNSLKTDLSSSTYEALIISDGIAANGFTQMYMLDKASKLIAEVCLEKEQEENVTDILIIKPKRLETTKLFLLANNCLLLQISENIDLGLANQLTLIMKPFITASKRVISLVSRHISNYRCDSVNDLPPAFVRGLSTSTQPLPPALKHLEQPNFISSASASVLGWCEATQKPGLILISYSDQMSLDAVTLTPLLKAFSDSGLSSYIVNEQPASSYSDPLKNLDRTFMYM